MQKGAPPVHFHILEERKIIKQLEEEWARKVAEELKEEWVAEDKEAWRGYKTDSVMKKRRKEVEEVRKERMKMGDQVASIA